MGHQLATTYNYHVSSGGGGVLISLIIGIAFYVLTSLGLYGTFIKAGQPGWAGFVPFYNFIILLKVAGRPNTWGWFLLLLIVPYLGWLAFYVVYIIVANDVSKSFGHGPGFTVGLVIPYVSVVFYYILWLGPSQYRGPAASSGTFGGSYGAPPMGGYQPAQPGYPPASGSPPAPAPPPPIPSSPPPQPGQAPPPPGQMPPLQ